MLVAVGACRNTHPHAYTHPVEAHHVYHGTAVCATVCARVQVCLLRTRTSQQSPMGHATVSPVLCWALAVPLLLLAPTATRATPQDIPISANTVQAIKTAIASAVPGDTVVIPAGANIDFGQDRVTLPPGVSLRGAGFRSTTFRSSQTAPAETTPCTTSVQDPLLCITGTASATYPTIIQGIAFNNSAKSAPPLTTPYRGPSMGIYPLPRPQLLQVSKDTRCLLLDCIYP